MTAPTINSDSHDCYDHEGNQVGRYDIIRKWKHEQLKSDPSHPDVKTYCYRISDKGEEKLICSFKNHNGKTSVTIGDNEEQDLYRYVPKTELNRLASKICSTEVAITPQWLKKTLSVAHDDLAHGYFAPEEKKIPRGIDPKTEKPVYTTVAINYIFDNENNYVGRLSFAEETDRTFSMRLRHNGNLFEAEINACPLAGMNALMDALILHPKDKELDAMALRKMMENLDLKVHKCEDITRREQLLR